MTFIAFHVNSTFSLVFSILISCLLFLSILNLSFSSPWPCPLMMRRWCGPNNCHCDLRWTCLNPLSTTRLSPAWRSPLLSPLSHRSSSPSSSVVRVWNCSFPYYQDWTLDFTVNLNAKLVECGHMVCEQNFQARPITESRPFG